MGFTTKDPKLANRIDVVASDLGRGQFKNRQVPKMRLWVLADRTAVIITPTPDGKSVSRVIYTIESGTHYAKSKLWHVNLYAESVGETSDDASLLTMDSNGCGCGFGLVSNAAPVDAPHYLGTVRPDAFDWWEEAP